MKNTERIVSGIAISTMIYLLALFIGRVIKFDNAFFAPSFPTHTIMLLLSVIAIMLMKKYMAYTISLPQFKLIWKPILYALVTAISVNFILTIIIKLAGGPIEAHPLIAKLNPAQVFLFAFIYAPIAEELLFRGFLLNMLEPLKARGITFFKTRISLPVIISALMFGFAHLSLISFGMSFFFLLRIVVFAMSLGLIAGYYQEKYNNNSYAIIVHMSGNFLLVLSVLLLKLSA